MILAAGLGKRMWPITRRLPKPLFPILDKTLLEIAIDTAKRANPQRIVINVHHLAEKIVEFIESRDFGVEIHLSYEPEILGTAGGIKAARRWLDDGDFAVINSDIVAEVDWPRLAAAHRDSGAGITLLLRPNPDPGRYTPLHVDEGGRIVDVGGNGGDEHAPKMFTGVSILSPSVFDRIAEGRAVDMAGEVYAPMIGEGGSLFGLTGEGDWIDAGTLQGYHRAVMKRFETYDGGPPQPPEKFRYVKITPPVYIHPKSWIRAGALIGPNVAIHKEAMIGASVYMKNCVVTPRGGVRSGVCLEGEVL